MVILEKLRRMAVGAVAICGTLLWIGFCIGSTYVTPKHALVLCDEREKYYLAPSCVDAWSERGERTEAERILLPYSLQTMTVGEARKAGYKPERTCRDQGGFTQEGRSLTGDLLERIGILPKLKSRWNADGTWNW
jgi:hypothetical protein